MNNRKKIAVEEETVDRKMESDPLNTNTLSLNPIICM